MIAAAPNPRLLALGGLVAMACAIGIGRFIYTPILPRMAEGLHLSQGQAGLIASMNFAGYLVGAVVAAWPRGRRNPRPWLLASLAASALSTGAMGLASGMPEFLAWRFIGGIASAFVLILASALVLDRLAAAGHGSLSAVHFAGVGAGIAVSALLTWGLAAAGLDWRAMWLGGGGLSLIGLAAVAAYVPAASSGSFQSAASTPSPRDKRLALLTVAYGLFGFGYVITATFIVVIVRANAQAAQVEPVFWFLLGLAAIPSVALWVGAGQRVGVINAFGAACIAEAAGVLASVIWQTIAGLLVASILLGGTFMGLTALGLIAARDLSPREPRRWLAILTAAFGLGQIAGPIVAGYGFDLTGSFFVPSMLAVAALCSGAMLAFVIGRRAYA